MSPPIREGSGSSIGSIRLGDGSEIAEVRTGAGDVLFSAIPDAPNNAIHQYHVSSFNASVGDILGNWTDEVSNDTMNVSGPPTLETQNGVKYVRLQSGDLYQTTSSVYPSSNTGSWSIFVQFYDPSDDVDRFASIDSVPFGSVSGSFKIEDKNNSSPAGGDPSLQIRNTAAITYDGSNNDVYAEGSTTEIIDRNLSLSLDSGMAIGGREAGGTTSDDIFIREVVFFDVEKTASEYQNYDNSRV